MLFVAFYFAFIHKKRQKDDSQWNINMAVHVVFFLQNFFSLVLQIKIHKYIQEGLLLCLCVKYRYIFLNIPSDKQTDRYFCLKYGKSVQILKP